MGGQQRVGQSRVASALFLHWGAGGRGSFQGRPKTASRARTCSLHTSSLQLKQDHGWKEVALWLPAPIGSPASYPGEIWPNTAGGREGTLLPGSVSELLPSPE